MGVRHRGPRGLNALVAAVLLALAPACASVNPFGLDEDEQARLDVFTENAQTYYDRGHYAQALHSADQALLLDEDLTSMMLVKAMCLLKVGQANQKDDLVEQSLELFDVMLDTWSGEDDFRIQLGAGQAHLARALRHGQVIAKIDQRLGATFLDAEGRRNEEALRARQVALRTEHLERAERHLSTVLGDEGQADNVYAMIDLVLVLSSQGGRDPEIVAHASRALELLAESTRVTQAQLDNLTKLSPEGRLQLERRIDSNLAKEQQLRDLVATVHYNRGDRESFLVEIAGLEQRGLATDAHYYNRARVHEEAGRYAEALADLETCLRLRARRLSYESDALAPELFTRIDDLQQAVAGGGVPGAPTGGVPPSSAP